MTKATMIGTGGRKYDKAVIPLYSSVKGGVQGKTVKVDKHQKIHGNKKVLTGVVTMVMQGIVEG